MKVTCFVVGLLSFAALAAATTGHSENVVPGRTLFKKTRPSKGYCRAFRIPNGVMSPLRYAVFAGQSITYTCNTGYRMVGAATLRCERYSGFNNSPPRCVADETQQSLPGCFKPAAPANSYIKPREQNHFYVGDKIWVVCLNGTSLKGETKDVTCTSTGWFPALPTCESDVVKCPRAHSVRYASYRPYSRSFDVGATVKYTCRRGYITSDETTVECLATGKWDTRPVCRRVTCPRPVAPANAITRRTLKTSYRINERVYYSCERSYTRSGPSSIKCGYDGKWTLAPSCSGQQCAVPETPENGSFEEVKTSYNEDDSVTFSCRTGYSLKGANTITCKSGTWSANEPICILIPCRNLKEPSRGSVSPRQSGFFYQDVATFECDRGYDLMGSSSITCGSDGQWSDDEPTCDAVTCGPLTTPDNGEKSLDRPRYRINDEVTFTCARGYERVGAAQVTCQYNGEWSDEEPICVAIQCAVLDAPDNGSLDPAAATEFFVDDTITFACDDSYMLIGQVEVTCLTSSDWSAPVPTCRAITCDPLVAPANGEIDDVKDSYDVSDVVNFSCDENFELIGATSSECLTTGIWSESEPICEPIVCQPVEAPLDGSITNIIQDEYNVDDIIVFSCNEGFTLIGEETIVCQSTRDWSDEVPICEAVMCDPLTAPVDGSILSQSLAVNGETVFDCDEGFQLIGESVSTCLSGGIWTNDEPICEARQCRELEVPANGGIDIAKDLYEVRDIVVFNCNPGYVLAGDAILTCQSSGLWDFVEPICEAVMCGPLVAPADGTLDPDQDGYGVDDVITFTCDRGFQLVGDEQVTCLNTAEWSNVEPTCQEITCRELKAPAQGSKDPSDQTSSNVDDQVTFACDFGYTLVGSETLRCLESGDWNGDEPICEEIPCTTPVIPDSGSIQENNPFYAVGLDVFFSCIENYELVGVDRLRCELGGTWNDVEPFCEKITCQKPGVPDNGFIDPDQDEYNVDVSVNFECNIGYTRIGFESITCRNDRTWSDVEPVCEANMCGALARPDNGQMTNVKDSYAAEEMVTFTCDEGYTLFGVDKLTCLDTGVWSDIEPICDANTCQPLVAPNKGSLSPIAASYVVSATITFKCDDGYFLDGTATVTCESDGNWSNIEPTCEAEMCTQPEVPVNGFIFPISNMYRVNAVVEFSCKSCYDVVGPRSIRCTDNGQWSDDEPTCQANTCFARPAPDSGSQGSNADVFDVNDVNTYTCDVGYVISGSSQSRCLCDGSWSTDVPTCEEIRCRSLNAPTNGQASDNQQDYAVNSVVTFTCDDSYDLSGDDTLVCLDTGRWSSPEPTCSGVTCRTPKRPRYGFIRSKKPIYSVGEEATFGCRRGFRAVGSNPLVCQDTGLWDDEEPTCSRITCRKLNKPENGGISTSRTTFYYRYRVYFFCNSGFAIAEESNLLTCQLDGTWNATEPTCVPVSCRALNSPDKGFYSPVNDEYSVNDVATFGCEEGYKISGKTNRLICLKSGRWSYDEPRCVPVTCDAPRDPARGTYGPRQASYPIFDTITFSCDEGLVVKGEAVQTCEISGRWSSTVPYCVVPKCDAVQAPVNGGLSPRKPIYNLGDDLWFSCNFGYTMDNQLADVICELNGWSGPVPTCRQLSCAGRCNSGVDANLGCQCNYGCGARGNCCLDYTSTCGGV